MKTTTVIGTPSGDMECWCLDLTEEEYAKFVGEKRYREELVFRKEMEKEGCPLEKWRLYPSDLIGDHTKPIKITVIVEEI